MKTSLHIQRLLRPIFLSLATVIATTSFSANAVEQKVTLTAEEKNLYDEAELDGKTLDLLINSTEYVTEGYFVGSGITGFNTTANPSGYTLTLPEIKGSVNITNTGGNNAGAIGTAITQARVTLYTANLTVYGGGEARGLGMSNLNYFNSDIAGAVGAGAAGRIDTLRNTIKVTQTGLGVVGQSYGIHLEHNSSIGLVDAGTVIDVESASGSAAGIFLNLGGHIGTIGSTAAASIPVTIDVSSNNYAAMGISIDNTILGAGDLSSTIDTIGRATLTVESTDSHATGINLKSSGALIGAITGTAINASAITTGTATGINLDGAGTRINSISGATINSMSNSGSTFGIMLSGAGEASLNPGLGATIASITDTNIKVDSNAGSAHGIYLDAGTTLSAISNTDIIVQASGSVAADATGIRVKAGAFLGTIENVSVTVTTTGTSAVSGMVFEKDAIPYGSQLTGYAAKNVTVDARGTSGAVGFVSGYITEDYMNYAGTPGKDNLGAISGTFSMISDESTPGGMSVGYTLAKLKTSTEFSLGFQNVNDSEPSDGGVKYEDTSFGYIVDWSNTSMHVQRNMGYTAGSIIVGSQRVTDMGLSGTILGKDNVISAYTMQSGSTVATFIQGVDLSKGELRGTLYAFTGTGAVGGLGTVGTSIDGGNFIPQTTDNSIMNHIGGNITAELGAEDAYGKLSVAIGAHFGDVDVAYTENDLGEKFYADYQTQLVGDFSGSITAQINDLRLNSGSPYSTTVVAAVITHGEIDNGISEVLRFDTRANAEHEDPAGVTFSALIYDIDNTTGAKSLATLGQAISSAAGDINLSATTAAGVKTTGVVNLNGDLTAGKTGDQSLTFRDGRYNVVSNEWRASEGIHVGMNNTDGLHGTTTISLRDYVSTTHEAAGNSIEIVTTTLTFTGNNESDVSKILVGAGMSLEFTDLANVTIDLKGDADYYTTYFENGGDAIFFVDRGAAAEFDQDNTGINYVLKLNGVEVNTNELSYKIYHDQYGIYISDEVAPEPSTATLSLLALAGLLARRRRKQQG